jgi:hypothetical protein
MRERENGAARRHRKRNARIAPLHALWENCANV